MRALMYSVITGAPSLTNLIPAERWIGGGAVDEPPARPFAVIRITDSPLSISKAAKPTVQIWVHDNRGSYTKIDRILEALHAVLIAVEDLEDATSRIACIEWTGDSPDLVDTDYNTNVRYATFSLTGRK